MKTKFQTGDVGTSRAISAFFIPTCTPPPMTVALDLHPEEKGRHGTVGCLKRGVCPQRGTVSAPLVMLFALSIALATLVPSALVFK